jgi:hypothetical protein
VREEDQRQVVAACGVNHADLEVLATRLVAQRGVDDVRLRGHGGECGGNESEGRAHVRRDLLAH